MRTASPTWTFRRHPDRQPWALSPRGRRGGARAAWHLGTYLDAVSKRVDRPAGARAGELITPGKLQQSFFTNSGSEADEMGVLLAKMYTGRSEIIALRHSYSGRGMYAISAMGHASWRPIPPVMPGISLMSAPYCYRCPFGLSYPSCDIRCADDVKEVIATTTTGQPAAFIWSRSWRRWIYHPAQRVLSESARACPQGRRPVHL